MLKGLNRGSFSTHTHTQVSVAEQGRSLTEMLGTLAIMAIISMVGIKMFNAAMTQHRANELINEANKRAVTVAAQIMAGREKNALSIDEFPNPTGYTFGVEGNATNNNRFNITVGAVDVDVCKKMKSMIGPYTVLRALSSDCTTLTFNDDLSRDAMASDYDTDKSACEAIGKKWCQYGDNGTANKCLSDSTDCCAGVEYNSQCQTCATTGAVSNKSGSCTYTDPTTNTAVSGTCNSGVCVKSGISTNTVCTSNAQCGGAGSGWYCQISYTSENLNGTSTATNESCYKNLSGKCALATGKMRLTAEQKALLTQAGFSTTFTRTTSSMNWWSAKNWCEAQGKQLIDVAEMGCYQGSQSVQSGTSTSSCCKAPGSGCSPKKWQTILWNDKSIVPGQVEEVAKFSDKLVALRKAFGAGGFWSSSAYATTSQNSCYAYYIGPGNGYATSNSRNVTGNRALCQ